MKKKIQILLALLMAMPIIISAQGGLTEKKISSSEKEKMDEIFLETKAQIAQVFEESGIKIHTPKRGKTPLYLMNKSFGLSLKDKDIHFEFTKRWISVSEIRDGGKNTYHEISNSKELKEVLTPVYEEISRLRVISSVTIE